MFAEPPLHNPWLRIGIMLDSFIVEAWLAKILDDVAAAPYLHVALIIFKRQTKHAPRSLWKELTTTPGGLAGRFN